MNQVAAIIINRNTREYLRDCLASLTAQEFTGGVSVWVVVARLNLLAPCP